MKTIILKEGDIEYTLGDGIGSWAKSKEYNVKRGDVRMIGNRLMYVYTVYTKIWSKHTVNWVPVDRTIGHDYVELNKWVNKCV